MREPEQFVDWAKQLIEDPEQVTSSAWPRAAALLGRAALEASMSELWATKAPGIANASWRAQLLCLSGYVDRELAADSAYAYAALSSACHHHPYDLPPTALEVQSWLRIVRRLIDTTASSS